MAKLLLVRHGLTDFNSNRRFAGYSDVELSAAGYRQVERLRDRLAAEKMDAAYSSDLKRAAEAARVVIGGRQLQVTVCPELREINYGGAEGLTFKEIGDRYPEVAERCIHFTLDLAFPGGETFAGFARRARAFLDRVTDHDPTRTVLVVSHSGPLRVLVCELLGIGLEHWWQMRIDNASLTVIDTYPRGAILNLLNDTSHLK